jgi:hypothetical protein
VGFFSATFLQALERFASLSGLQKRHIQPERYVQFGPTSVANILKIHIDRIKTKKYNQERVNK